MNASSVQQRVIGIGEALFDVLPTGAVLGGAPLNVMIQLHQLAGHQGVQALLASRIGQDPEGERMLSSLRERGMDTSLIQSDPDRATGMVYVDFDADGSPRYEIAADAAWDVLQWDFDLEDVSQRCAGVCFGSLAQRDAQTRNTIYRMLELARRSVRLFDVNLREPFVERQNIQRSCDLASILKLNTEELPIVAGFLGVDVNVDDPQTQLPQALLKRTSLEMVVLTRGKEGTRLITREQVVDGAPKEYPAAANADTVGCGDATSAAVLVGRLRRWPLQRIADLANDIGAFVASQPGGTPALPEHFRSLVAQ